MWFRRRPTSRAAPNDARLIQLYVTTGQLEHLGDLYDRYMPLVYGVCLKYLQDEEASKDAVMQVFEKNLPKGWQHLKDTYGRTYVILTSGRQRTEKR